MKQARSARLNDKIAAMKLQMAALKEIEAKLEATGETQISLTDPDVRSMMTRGSGIVGYNVQTAVDANHHLIVEHEVSNIGNDRDQLSGMAKKAPTAIGTGAREDRNEPARARLQRQTVDVAAWSRWHDGGDQSVCPFTGSAARLWSVYLADPVSIPKNA